MPALDESYINFHITNNQCYWTVGSGSLQPQ